MGDRGKSEVGPVVRPRDRISLSDVGKDKVGFQNVKREFHSFLLERVIPEDGRFTDIPFDAHEEKVNLHTGPSPLHEIPINNFVLLKKHFNEFLESLGFYREFRDKVQRERDRIDDFIRRRNEIVRHARKPLPEEAEAESLRIRLLKLTRDLTETRKKYEEKAKVARAKRKELNREAAGLFSKRNDYGNVDTPVLNYYRKKEMLDRATFIIHQTLVDIITDPGHTFGVPGVTPVETMVKAYYEKTGKKLFAEIENELEKENTDG